MALLYGGLYQIILLALVFLDLVLGVVLSLLYSSTYLHPLLFKSLLVRLYFAVLYHFLPDD